MGVQGLLGDGMLVSMAVPRSPLDVEYKEHINRYTDASSSTIEAG
jgi:hypothetical protein